MANDDLHTDLPPSSLHKESVLETSPSSLSSTLGNQSHLEDTVIIHRDTTRPVDSVPTQEPPYKAHPSPAPPALHPEAETPLACTTETKLQNSQLLPKRPHTITLLGQSLAHLPDGTDIGPTHPLLTSLVEQLRCQGCAKLRAELEKKREEEERKRQAEEEENERICIAKSKRRGGQGRRKFWEQEMKDVQDVTNNLGALPDPHLLSQRDLKSKGQLLSGSTNPPSTAENSRSNISASGLLQQLDETNELDEMEQMDIAEQMDEADAVAQISEFA